MEMTRERWAIAGAGIAAVAAAGAALFYWNEKSAEKPGYRSVDAVGSFEVRDYPGFLAAETVTFGERKDALDYGFGILANYIFAKSRGGEEIAMTAPVLSAPARNEKIAMTAPVLSDAAEGEGWRTRFVMPEKYTRATLPPPPANVTIADVPARRVAALRFAGMAGDDTLAAKEAELRRMLDERGLVARGPVEYAFYNSPFIPGPLRRNEVLIPVG